MNSSKMFVVTLAVVAVTLGMSMDRADAQSNTHVIHFRNNGTVDEDYYTVKKADFAPVCWEICKKDSRCKSAMVNEKRKQCWLRDKLPSTTKLRAWNYNNYGGPGRKIHTGLKMTGAQKARYDKLVANLVKKTRRKGKELERYKKVSTARLCAGLCAVHGQCKSLAYRRWENSSNRHSNSGKGGTCVLFTDTPNPFSENVFFSSAL